ncbi:MAG: hypothetical protein H6672_19970 [Anaerolineaceae bacterium]|nr:hypothetical protein [Anaerolineaceae bacterium]
MPSPDSIIQLLTFMVIAVYGVLPIVSVLIGIGLDRTVERASPIINPLTITLLLGVFVAAAILLVLIGPNFPTTPAGFIAALLVSTAIPMAIGLGIAVIFWRRFRADAARLRDRDKFTVWGEDPRKRPKNLRRR